MRRPQRPIKWMLQTHLLAIVLFILFAVISPTFATAWLITGIFGAPAITILGIVWARQRTNEPFQITITASIPDKEEIAIEGEGDDIDAFINSIDPKTMRDGKYLREISAAREAVEASQQRLHDAVTAARAAGDSWTMIGLMLRTTKQNAHRKYGTPNDPTL